MKRLQLLIAALLISGGLMLNTVEASEITVYKSPTCGCCNAWIKHLERHGFEVLAKNVEVDPIKNQLKVPERLRACHTAIVEGYVIEGHVPAGDIKRLLQARPDVAGLAVPGMPMGSPGMEGPYKQPYKVMSFGDDGAVEFFAQH